MKSLYTILLSLLSITTSVAQGLNVNWTRLIGANSCCTILYAAIPTRDGGIAFTGSAEPYDTINGDIPPTSYGGVMAGKIDSNGNLLWIHLYGGSFGEGICQTPDGGYGILAYTGDIGAADGYMTGYKGGGDIWLLKIDSTGNFLWGNCFGSIVYDEEPLSISTTKDNGFILLGVSNGEGQDVPFHLGGLNEFEYDWFVVKTDSAGNKQWVDDLGGSSYEDLFGSIVAADSGYYLFGTSFSTDYDCIDTAWHAGVNTNSDYYILRLDDTGGLIWAKSFGGSGGERTGIAQCATWDSSDKTIVVTGASTSDDYMVTGNTVHSCAWTIKVNKSGNLVWEKSLEGTSHGCEGAGINMVPGIGYVCVGNTSGVVGTNTDNGIFVLDTSGNIIADTIFGGTLASYMAYAFPYNNGYIAAGTTYSNDGFTQGINYGTLGYSNANEIASLSYLTCCPTLIKNVTSPNENMQLYPNPAKESVTVSVPSKGILKIKDIVGRTVFEKQVNANGLNASVNIAGWADGLYIVCWYSEDGTGLWKKLSKEK